MTRRALTALLTAANVEGQRLPVDISKLNNFAELYNAYVKELSESKVNAKLWAQVERAWKRL